MPEHKAYWNDEGTTLFIEEAKPYTYPQKWKLIWQGAGTEAEQKVIKSLSIAVPVKPYPCESKAIVNGLELQCERFAPHEEHWHRKSWEKIRIDWQ